MHMTQRHWVVDAQPPLTKKQLDTMTRQARVERVQLIREACNKAGIQTRTCFNTEKAARDYAKRVVAPVIERLGEEPYVGESIGLSF